MSRATTVVNPLGVLIAAVILAHEPQSTYTSICHGSWCMQSLNLVPTPSVPKMVRLPMLSRLELPPSSASFTSQDKCSVAQVLRSSNSCSFSFQILRLGYTSPQALNPKNPKLQIAASAVEVLMHPNSSSTPWSHSSPLYPALIRAPLLLFPMRYNSQEH